MNRNEMIKTLDSREEPWDILIIGGGASGIGAAVDAAQRGYSVLLVEKYDFAKGTSSRSTKLAHGGVRYLQNGDISLVIEALRERGLMVQNAPHLVNHQSFVIPAYKWWTSPFYGIGLKIYNMMAGKLGLGPSTMLDKEETISHLPNIKRTDLQGGVIYYDGQFDDARMAISLAATAADQGATLINYMGVSELIKKDGMVSGAKVKDSLTGKEHSIDAKAVVNATGVFSDDILQMDNPKAPKKIMPSQGVHITLDKKFLKGEHAIMVPNTSDGRVLFAVPWIDRVIVGTTDTLIKDREIEPVPLEEEIDFILTTAADYMDENPTRKDIRSVFAGLRPLAAQDPDLPTKEVSRSHQVIVSDSGLVSIIGGKWTTYRQMAEETIHAAAGVAGLMDVPCATQDLKIHGYQETPDWSDPYHIYGSHEAEVRSLGDPKSMVEDTFISEAQVIWAVREEMAQTVEDVLARRTRILFLDAHRALEVAPRVAEIMRKELGENEDWINKQLERFRETAAQYVVQS